MCCLTFVLMFVSRVVKGALPQDIAAHRYRSVAPGSTSQVRLPRPDEVSEMLYLERDSRRSESALTPSLSMSREDIVDAAAAANKQPTAHKGLPPNAKPEWFPHRDLVASSVPYL